MELNPGEPAAAPMVAAIDDRRHRDSHKTKLVTKQFNELFIIIKVFYNYSYSLLNIYLLVIINKMSDFNLFIITGLFDDSSSVRGISTFYGLNKLIRADITFIISAAGSASVL